jgi:uncharacterized membrane protein YfcA
MDWIVPECATAPPWLYVLVTAGATLLMGVAKGGFGGGVGVLATPLLLLVLPANVALSMLLPLLIVCDVFTLGHFPRDWHPRSYGMIAGGTLIGLAIGLYLLLFFARSDVDGDRWIRLFVGAIALFFCLLKAWRVLRREKPAAFRPGWGIGTAVGILCGITTMVAHAAGLLVAMFLVAQRLEPRKFVGTTARYYLTFNTVKVPLYLLATTLGERDYITWETLRWNLWLLPLCPLGVAVGAWLNKRMRGTVFTLIIYVLLALTAVKMLVA